MKRITKILSLLFVFALLVGIIPTGMTAQAANDSWAGSWGTPAIESGIVLGDNEDGLHLQDYIPSNSTIRTVITPTIGGTKIRLKFSNYFSPKPVTLTETTVAQTGDTNDVVDEKTITQVTFNGGQKSVTIAAGSEIYSDPITFNTTAHKKISISTYFKNRTSIYTEGLYGGVTYLTASLGNRTHKADMTKVASRLTFTSSSITYYTIPFLTRLDVYAPNAYCVVLLGDSTLTNEISVMLSEKLHANGIHNVGVVMSGIIGNALLHEGTGLLGKIYGESLLDRAERDAFTVAGAKYVIVKIGDNDVLHPMLKSNEGKLAPVTASQVIAGYRQLSQKAYGRGINLYLCTRTPYKGYTRNFMGGDDLEWSQKGEDILLEINSWVKNTCTSFNYAGHINLDALRDPQDSTKLRDHMTTDGIHFSQYGQIAVVDLIPEYVYGVDRELKDYAEILGIDPYVAPVVETPTKKPDSNAGNNQNNSSGEKPTEGTNKNPVIIGDAETPTKPSSGSNSGVIVTPNINIENNINNNTQQIPNANEILVQDPMGNNSVNGNVVNVSAEAARQMAGFAILAAVAMAIIAVASVMLVKMRPSSGSSLARGGKGRANQKKRV